MVIGGSRHVQTMVLIMNVFTDTNFVENLWFCGILKMWYNIAIFRFLNFKIQKKMLVQNDFSFFLFFFTLNIFISDFSDFRDTFSWRRRTYVYPTFVMYNLFIIRKSWEMCEFCQYKSVSLQYFYGGKVSGILLR